MTEEKIGVTSTRFKLGDPVPPWLLDTEPMSVDATPGEFIFAVAVDVIDLPDCYIVLPLYLGPAPPPLRFTGNGCKIFASAKMVRIVTSQMDIQTDAVGAWGGPVVVTGPPQQPQQEVHYADFVRGEMRRPWWKRLFS